MKRDYFKGKVMIITGASSGIGLASAKLFASLGAKLVLAARSQDKLEEIASGISHDSGSDVLCVKTDVSVEEDCRNLIDKAVARFGRIDVLVNNAGLSMRALFRDLDLPVIKTLMDVNFWGTVYCTKYALPYLLESKGSVVGVISIAGYAGLPARTGYASSKYAIRGFLDTLRIEHLYDGLHVMVFAPGAEKVAEYLAKGLIRRKSHMILTPIGKLTVLMHNLWPSLTDRLEFSSMAKEPDSPFHKK